MEAASNDEWVMLRYKYLKVSESSLKVLTDGTVYFASPLKFNDPFDSAPVYDDQSIQKIFKRRPDLIKYAGDQLGLSPAGRIQHKSKMLANIRKTVDSGEWAHVLMASTGVLCLSRNPCNPLMWAHYADEHRGFLVEFRVSESVPDHLRKVLLTHPVEYTDQRPILDWGAVSTPVESYFLTKSTDWAYEEEERSLDTQSGPGAYPYSREHMLCSVTAGVRITEHAFEQLRRAVMKAEEDSGKHIPLYRAKLSPSSYKVYIPDHPDPAISSPL